MVLGFVVVVVGGVVSFITESTIVYSARSCRHGISVGVFDDVDVIVGSSSGVEVRAGGVPLLMPSTSSFDLLKAVGLLSK